MRVLIISSNTLPASPSGPAYVAGAVRQAGHSVEVYESLFASDLAAELGTKIQDLRPDVVGISIRLVQGDVQDPGAPLGTRHLDLRPRVKQIVDTVRQNSTARIVLGGPGFSYYARDWLEYLGLDYGICGEGEVSFPLYLQSLEQGGDLTSVPGSAFQKDGGFHTVPPQRIETWDPIALPAYDLFDMEAYARRKISPAIFTKRGCACSCTYCPYSKLEGRRYREKGVQRVLAEIRHILDRIAPTSEARRILFCDNNFNMPRQHAEALCRAIIAEQLVFQWGTGDLRPVGVTQDFCHLLEDSGCFYANLAVESASDRMLQRMKRGYTVQQVRRSLETLSRSKIPFGASLMLGAPGETPETVAETLAVMSDYEIPLGVWVTIGVYLWTDLQEIVAEMRQEGRLLDEGELFSGAVYCSPELPGEYLEELVQALRSRPGYTVQVNQAGEEWALP